MNENSATVLWDRDLAFTDLRPIPARVAADMRTLERPPANLREERVDFDGFVDRARKVLAEIRIALWDDLGRHDGVTALGVGENRNNLTGARGLILRRFQHRGRYSEPLGEIFSPTGRLDQQGRDNFDAFREFISRYGLRLWIHEVAAGERRSYIAFAIFRESEDSDRFCYAARLLVTPFERSQWRDEFLEVDGSRPS